jgi:hypothetical protein
MEAHRLAAWRGDLMAGRASGLKAKPLTPEDRRLREADHKFGELTLENEILQAAARNRGLRFPHGGRRGERGGRRGDRHGV